MVYPCTFVPWRRVCGAFAHKRPFLSQITRYLSAFYAFSCIFTPTPPDVKQPPRPRSFPKIIFLFFQRLSPLFLYVFASVYIFGVSISFRLFCRFMCSGSIYAPVFVRTMDCATELLSRPCEVFFVRFGRFLLFGCGFTCFCGKLRFCCSLVFVLQLMV